MGKRPVPSIHDARLIIGRDDSDNPRQIRVSVISGVSDQGYLPVILLGQDPSGDPINIATDEEGRILGAYEGDLTFSMGDVEKLLASWYWLSTRIEYDSNTPKRIKYIGFHTTMNKATSDSDWRLIHIDYDGTSTRITGVWKQIDAWDDRDSPATAWP